MAHLIPGSQLIPIPPKPIFVMRLHNSMDDMTYNRTREDIHKSELVKEYHVIVIRSDKDKDEFEMYNADKIERQDWNKIVNQILK
jgi:hypothetical protein